MKTSIPPQQIPFIDGRGFVSREWYLYLLNQFERLGGGNSDTTIPGIESDVAAIEVNIDAVEADITAIESVNTAQGVLIADLQADVAQGGADISDLQGDVSDLQSDKEDVANKVTAWSSPTTDINYPSEKLVRDTILPLEPATYYPASMTVSAGTLDTGTYTNLAALGGTDVNISEATGASPLTVVFGFTGVTKLSGFSFYGRYSGGAGHQMLIEAYNYTLASWNQLGIIGTDTTKRWYSFPVFSPNDYMSGGASQIRFSHVQNGIPTHDMIFDLVALYFGALSGQSNISAAAVTFAPAGDISATNVGSALMELDNEKAATSHTQAESTITFTDITTGDVSASAHGYCPKLPGNTTTFLRGDGSFAAASGGVSDGDKGDITVATSGTVWTIDNGVVTEAKLSIADNTTANVSTSAHGFCPKLPNNTATFLRGDGTYATPSGGSTYSQLLSSISLRA
jgi:hypothetical protein